MARIKSETCFAGREKSTRQSSFLIFLQRVASASLCGVKVACPFSTSASARAIHSPPSRESFSDNDPAVSADEIGISSCSSISPVSSPTSVRMTVIPVLSSPAAIAC